MQSLLSGLTDGVKGQANLLLGNQPSPSTLMMSWGDETIQRGEMSDPREITENFDAVVVAPDPSDDDDDDDDDDDSEKKAAQAGPQMISDTTAFQNLVMYIIFANSACIALEAWYITNQSLQHFFSVFEFCFTCAYCLEIRQRWRDHGVRGYFCNPNPFWNYFDFIITSMGVVSLFGDLLAGSSAIRLFRILRLARSLRIAKFAIDIEYVLKMALFATMKLFLLTCLSLFMFSILFTEMLWNTGHPDIADKFGELSKTLWTLFMLFTMSDWADEVAPVIAYDPSMAALFVAFIFLASIALLTLTPAMFVDQSMTRRERDKEDKLKAIQREQKRHDRELLQECFALADTNKNNFVSLHEMKAVLNEERIIDSLHDSDLARDRDMKDIKLGLFDLVQHHESELSHTLVNLTKNDFVGGIFRQRDDKSHLATWRSATSVRLQMTKFKARLHHDMHKMDNKLDDLHDLLAAVHAKKPGNLRPGKGLRGPIQTAQAGPAASPKPSPKSSPKSSPRQSPRTSPRPQR